MPHTLLSARKFRRHRDLALYRGILLSTRKLRLRSDGITPCRPLQRFSQSSGKARPKRVKEVGEEESIQGYDLTVSIEMRQ